MPDKTHDKNEEVVECIAKEQIEKIQSRVGKEALVNLLETLSEKNRYVGRRFAQPDIIAKEIVRRFGVSEGEYFLLNLHPTMNLRAYKLLASSPNLYSGVMAELEIAIEKEC